MKGDKHVIVCLNRVLTNELTLISRPFLHSGVFKNWRFNKLQNYLQSQM